MNYHISHLFRCLHQVLVQNCSSSQRKMFSMHCEPLEWNRPLDAFQLYITVHFQQAEKEKKCHYNRCDPSLNNIDIICEWTERKWSADVVLNAENVLIFHVLLNQCSLKATVICVDHMNCFFLLKIIISLKFSLAKVKKWLPILWYITTCFWFHSRHGLTWTQCKITI